MILGVGRCTGGVVVRGELGWVRMETRRGMILLRFVGKLERLVDKEERLIGKLYRKGKEAWREGSKKCSKWWGRVERVYKEWGLGEVWMSGVVGGMKKKRWEELVEKRMLRAEKEGWKREVREMSSKEGSKVKLYEAV